MTLEEILNIIHKTIYQFFDISDDEEAISDKDKLLLEVNKAICNNLKALEQDSILDKIKADIEQGYCTVNNDYDHGRNYGLYIATQIIDKYREGRK